jgi:hypothetical protein
MDQLKNDYDKLRRLKSADEELRASWKEIRVCKMLIIMPVISFRTDLYNSRSHF